MDSHKVYFDHYFNELNRRPAYGAVTQRWRLSERMLRREVRELRREGQAIRSGSLRQKLMESLRRRMPPHQLVRRYDEPTLLFPWLAKRARWDDQREPQHRNEVCRRSRSPEQRRHARKLFGSYGNRGFDIGKEC